MIKRIKFFIRDSLRFLLGVRGYSYIRFIFTHHYTPNFNNPRSFSEKIIFRKFSSDSLLFSKYVDKYTVRNFVSNKIGSEYLIPLLKAKDHITPSDFDDLPNSFVLKTSNGGGGENVKVVLKKSEENLSQLSSLFNNYISQKIGSKLDENFYDIEKPSILFEKLIENEDGSPLLDYKFHVFKNGTTVNVLLQINSNYNTATGTKTLYDLSGKKSEIQFKNYNYGKDQLLLPKNFSLMEELAITLSEGFNYCRVDLYNVSGKIYFGEITFCPASGWDKVNSKDHDILLGELWGS